MAGALLAVGQGRLTCDDVAELLSGVVAEEKSQRQGWRGYTVAEARGLCLEKVYLPEFDDPNELMYGGSVNKSNG
jgi:tRNA U38,U39,U40 pseudouridine synthase TruA